MAAKLIVHLVPTATRLATDCPVCGWADLWHIALHRLSTSGVTTMHDVIRCARCERNR